MVLEAPDPGKKKTAFEYVDDLTPWATCITISFFSILKAQPHCWILSQAVANSQALGKPAFFWLQIP